MVETINPASSLTKSVTFAIHWCQSLLNTVRSDKYRPHQARELERELEGLELALREFEETTVTGAEDGVVELERPLTQCGNACKIFKETIDQSSRPTNRTLENSRDWVCLRYIGEDIDAFRRLLANYKAVINIALASASRATRSQGTYGEYKCMSERVVADLKDHLGIIDQRLDALRAQNSTDSDTGTDDISSMMAERLSLWKCLEFCQAFSYRIEVIYSTKKEQGTGPDCVPEVDDQSKVYREKERLLDMKSKLEAHMKLLMDRILTSCKSANVASESIEDLLRLQDLWSITCQCLHLCNRAEMKVNNISTIHNEAHGDAIQFIVSTNGIPIKGKNNASGSITRQVGGHLSDDTLQGLAGDLASIFVSDIRDEFLSPVTGQDQLSSGWKTRYGSGSKLAAQKGHSKE